MSKLFQDSVSSTATTGATSKLEAEARRPSPFEALPLLELGSTALGAILGVAVGYNSGAPDITRYVVNGTILGASLPIVAVVVYSGGLTAYSWSKHMTYTIERWSQRDLTGDHIIGDPAGTHTDILLPVNIPKPEPSVKLAGAERAYTQGDLRWLIQYVYNNPTWSGRDLRGVRLPSGDVLADYDADVVPFIDILERMRLLVGRGPGARGNLTADVDEALRRLRIPL